MLWIKKILLDIFVEN